MKKKHKNFLPTFLAEKRRSDFNRRGVFHKNKLRFKFIIVVLFLLIIPLNALDISGKIVNEKNEPLQNAVFSNTEKMVISNKNGEFFLKDVNEKDRIRIHLIGYRDQTYFAADLPALITLSIETISVSGYKVSGSLTNSELLLSAEKITLEIDEKSNYSNAADIISERADLQINGTALTGETQSVSLPGFDPRHTLVMLDGIPLNKSGEAFDIASIPVEIIDKIEIGKNSGNGNMGLVININTKQEFSKASASYKHTFGSFGLDKHSVNLVRTVKNWNVSFFLSKSFSRNDFKYKIPEEWNVPDKYETRKFNDKEIYDLNLNVLNINKIVNVDYKLIFQDYFKKLPGTIINPDYFKNSRTTGQIWRNFVKLSKPMKNYLLKADLFYSQEESTYDNTRLDSLYNTPLYRALSTTKQAVNSAKIYIEYVQPGFFFEYGLDYKNEQFNYKDKLQPDNSISQKTLQNYGAFAQTNLDREIYPSIWKLTGSARWDQSNQFKEFTSWNIAPEYTYQTLFDIILGGSVSNGFTYPSFLNLYWKGDTQTAGNPDLKKEKSLSWQIFGKIDWQKHFIKITYRQDKLEDMIVWFLEFNSKWKPQNIEKVEISTWNFEAEYKLSKFVTFNGIYSFVDARNKTENSDLYNEKLIYTPEKKINLKAKIEYENLFGSLSWKYVGKQNYTMDQQSDKQFISAYNLLNSSLSYNFEMIGLQFSVGARANNILNKMYEVYRYIPQPGFNWDVNVGVKWEFDKK
ncbi:MAG: TonB-dependent receptor plug domain-containing protein [Candidatus Cloacimonetes bacterium]|nr:TonB-dependent receptor plug domain-containing protein [Candidatus Cloacimonadota bacterium]MCF7812945.1 TonB-dependent receptor plug domain-containing protein [Candidatus Cloacimonadota bacterium]MCF7867156.1 TonB-dependent receptor plug domain-containing protein [Candidatus Cloacimonadota bacterium]MCF7882524.1 TonB-dependent receptor plug domain-containing protein [Candidatus Cloacimonadota bacterium]